ncbi:MAG: alpha/beta fold hydrolase [Chloroflexota bacterium]
MTYSRITVAVLILLGIFFALGPTVELDTTIQTRQLPDDLDRYLAESERQFPDITPGAEKTIVWADPEWRNDQPLALVYIHGFTATRQETAPVADLVAESLGANLVYTRLRGHGRSDDAMAEATVNGWINDAVEAVAIAEEIGDEVVVIATSTGAPLITWMAANGHLDEDVSAMVFLAPNFGPANMSTEILLWPWGMQLTRLILGPYRETEPVSKEHAMYWTTRYPTEALLPMMGTVQLARQSDLSLIEQPLLALYSEADTVISLPQMKRAFEEFGSTPKELIAIETDDPGGHILAGAIRSPDTTEPVAQRIIEFLTTVLDIAE